MFTKFYEKLKEFIKDNYKFLITLLIINLLFWIELPYVIYTPGGAINLKGRINVENEYKYDGKLQMAYVKMVKGSIPFLVASYIIPDWDITPKDEIKLENETMRDMVKKDKLALQESIDNATISAFKLLNEEINITNIHNIVTYITKEAKTDLKLYDEIISVNNININSLSEYKSIVDSSKVGDTLKLKVLRNNKEKEVNITIYNTQYGLKTGISMITTYDYDTKRKVKIKNRASESGPSGGMMLALGIYNSLVEYDITNGKNIVGTGTIDVDGNIGPIGGVKYKLIGAVKNNADIFICPKENYKEAKRIAKEKNYDIIIITDKDLLGVVNQLKSLGDEK